MNKHITDSCLILSEIAAENVKLMYIVVRHVSLKKVAMRVKHEKLFLAICVKGSARERISVCLD